MSLIPRFFRFAAAFAVACLPAVTARAEDRRADTGRLTIMTFNAQFLWDGEPPEEGQVQFPWKGAPTEAQARMEKIAAIIRQCDPDIVNLVEVENLEALTMLNDRYLPGRGYRPYLEKGRDTYTGQDVALLTRIDPEGGSIRRDDRKGQSSGASKSVSKNYIARFEVGGEKLALIGLHFLAQPNREDRRPEREAQSDAIRKIALEEAGEGYQVVIAGDFNDYDGSADSADHIDSSPITLVLSSLRAMNPATDADDLINAARFAPKPERYTAFWDQNDNGRIEADREFTSIDHILISRALEDNVRGVRFVHSHDPRELSDHFPILLFLEFGPAASQPAAAGLRISALLPNPEGDERDTESVTLTNGSAAPVDLAGWTVRDEIGQAWKLDAGGSLAAGETRTILRARQPMAMNNTGDTIELVAPNGRVVQTVMFGPVAEGQAVTIE